MAYVIQNITSFPKKRVLRCKKQNLPEALMANTKENVHAQSGTQRILTLLALCAALAGAFQGHSQITVKVDSTKNWQGYMNWYSTNDAYISGGAWGIADL